VGKKGTVKNKSLHAVLRDRISRLKRKTRSYSKSESEKALSCHVAMALTYGAYGGRSPNNYNYKEKGLFLFTYKLIYL